MAADPGRALTDAYKLRQSAISADVARQVAELWRVIDPAAVEATWPIVSRAVSQVVAQGYATSTASAVAYLRDHAAANGVDLGRLVTAPHLNAEQLETALRVTGPVAVKRAAAAGMSATNAGRAALVQLTGSTSRLALAGGRRTVERTIATADGIVGWRRESFSGRPCFFCAMLVSRGAVYRSEGTAGGDYHDHCSCQAVPLYEYEDEPEHVANLRQAWSDHSTGSGAEAIASWRRAYDSGKVPGIAAIERIQSAIIDRDLTTLTDDDLAGLLGTATREDEVNAVVAELDRRDVAQREAQAAEARRAAAAERRDAKRRAEAEARDAEYDRLVEAGHDPESAYADVYGVSVEQQRRDQAIESLRSNGFKGRNFDELSRAAFRDYVEQARWDAEAATNGALFNGTTRLDETRDVWKLFNGSEAYARANASEELLAYWQEHGRYTLEDFRASLLGGRLRLKGTAAWL